MPPLTPRNDDLGHEITAVLPARRVISLVPSLTESIALTRPGALIGATDWCTQPPDLNVTRIRGTKNPNCRAIIDLRPDIVIANQEENREIDVTRLRDAGIEVWVTRINTLDEAFTSLEAMFDLALGWPVPDWLNIARSIWSKTVLALGIRVAVVIWRDPWMVIGSNNFTNDVLTRLGLTNAFGSHVSRYPTVGIHDLDNADIDYVLLLDEPYAFSVVDGPEAFSTTRTCLANGRLLTWYGPSLLTARNELTTLLLPR